jgi:hypothetical protein
MKRQKERYEFERKRVKCIICGDKFLIFNNLQGNCPSCKSCHYIDADTKENLYRTWSIYKELEKRMPGIWRDIPRYKELAETFEKGGKYCIQCKRNLPWGDFGKKPGAPDGHSKWCQSCVEVSKKKRKAYNERAKNVKRRKEQSNATSTTP